MVTKRGREELGRRNDKGGLLVPSSSWTWEYFLSLHITNSCIFPYLTSAIASGNLITLVEYDRKIVIKNSFVGTEICF